MAVCSGWVSVSVQSEGDITNNIRMHQAILDTALLNMDALHGFENDEDVVTAFRYTGNMAGNPEKDLNAEAVKLGFDTFESALEALRQASAAARVTTKRAKAEPRPKLVKKVKKAVLPKLPPLPKGLKWPKLHFDQSPEFQKHGGIVRHLDKVWRRLIEARAVDMSVLRAFYPSTAQGIDSLRKRGGKLPDDLEIPHVQLGSGRRRVVRSPELTAG